MPSPTTYWHTLRHLKPIQLYGRIWFNLFAPRVDLRPAPPLRLPHKGHWVKPAQRQASLVGPDSFCFLNEIYSLDDHGWDSPAIGQLWRYNLHYFDDLNAIDASARTTWHGALLSRWVSENPPGSGTGWEPYPTSLRIVNWIKWALAGNTLPNQCVESLAIQTRWLVGRLEKHLLGNHLLANAKALVFAGLFFEGPAANRWLDTGLNILKKQLPEQILPDGGQFELSTMYHALALEDMLDLANISAAVADAIPLNWQSTVAHWRRKIALMRDWLTMMSHPDGEISFFNDAAISIAPSPRELENYANRLDLPDQSARSQVVNQLTSSGYIRIEVNQAVALLDVAAVGPDYLPAHAHADTLSFELSLYRQRVFINTGTSCYAQGEDRMHQRGTSAHNTVVINGQNSSEIWASFRVGRRARPINLTVTEADGVMVGCGHDGYRYLPGKPTHLRRWLFSENMLVIEDQIEGSFKHAQARFHIHPDIALEDSHTSLEKTTEQTMRLPQGQEVHVSVEGGTLRSEATTWHPEFGASIPNRCFVIDIAGSTLRTLIKWREGK